MVEVSDWLADIHNLLQTRLKGRWQEKLPLSQYTSWRVGGHADFIYFPANVDDLSLLLQHIPKTLPITWLGLGSNTLVRDGGIRGLVIITQGCLKSLEQTHDNEVKADVGVAAAQLARYSARLGLTGLEFLAGVPGTVGGALRMNAGCFGSETWQFVDRVDMLSRDGQITQFTANQFSIHYRHVDYNFPGWFISGYFKLQSGDKELSLQKIKTLLDKRASTQPTNVPTCGSVFRNPPGDFAGRLIEQTGLKGFRIGKVHISEKHGNFFVNEGGATAKDIEALITYVINSVEAKFSIRLHPEVHIIGNHSL